MNNQRIFSALIYGLALPLAAQPATHVCADVAAPAERLACYDAAFPPPPEVSQAAARLAEAGFGFSTQPDLTGRLDPMVGGTDLIESRVARIDFLKGGSRSFYLENDQVWVQAEADSRGHVQVGELVQVRKARLAGYQLITAAGVPLRVRRAQ